MKKATLAFGLFSLAAVATSFATPEIKSYLAQGTTIDIEREGEGGAAGGVRKKQDFAFNTKVSKNVNFASVNQTVGNDKKVD